MNEEERAALFLQSLKRRKQARQERHRALAGSQSAAQDVFDAWQPLLPDPLDYYEEDCEEWT